MKRAACAIGASILLSSGSALAVDRDTIAKTYAPVFYQQVRDTTRDLFAAYDFDGNWAGDDNEENTTCVAEPSKCAGSPCAGGACKLIGTVYYTVIETTTHWFVQYMPYHAVDTKVTNGHEHDTESVFAVIAKTGGAGKLLAYETRFHLEWFAYADASVKPAAKTPNGALRLDAKGRPEVYVQQVGHGFCGGYSPPNDLFPDLQLTCNHGEAPRLEGTGVIYRPDLPAAMPAVARGKVVEAGYVLTEMLTSFWSRRTSVGPGNTFKDLIDFNGERCDVLACPKQFGGAFMGDGGTSPSGPWNQEGGAGVSAKGSQFFDPAFTMQKRLTFPAPFSLDYCHNPYLSIPDTCPKDPEEPAATPPESTPEASAVPDRAPVAEPAPAEESEGGSGCATSPGPRGLGSAPMWLVGLALLSGALARRARRSE
ncbi:MAG: hypothetical protein KF819_17550 [Labilithrix sp.]|nr:hypothetical protein [Labilithrix sp.]